LKTMDHERWQTLNRLFLEAVNLGGEELEIFLTEKCSGNPELLNELRSLLDIHKKSGPLDTSLDKIAGQILQQFTYTGRKDNLVGPYKLIKELGTGGMGSVYLAERADGQYEHRVAVKFLLAGFTTDEQNRRFLTERQILATLQHENIARLLDGGVTDDNQPYFVMEHIEGEPLTEYSDNHKLSIRQRLNLFLKVCDAVQYAHRKLVVHRDIKPSNILVTGEGLVKLLDFGIAKMLRPDEDPLTTLGLTQPGLLPLTPSYASPEQIRGGPITTASDIYQLGLVLHELLTGCRPYDISGRSPAEIERIVCEEEPVRPSTALTTKSRDAIGTSDFDLRKISRDRTTNPEQLGKVLRGDLDMIILKALHKEHERRYATVGEFADDLRRYLDKRPVRARPETLRYRTGKFLRRNRISVAAVIFVFISLLGGIIGTSYQAHIAANERDRARIEAAKAERVSSFLIDLFRISDPGEARGQAVTARELLEKGAMQMDEELRDEPEIRATMLHVIGIVYRNLGLYDDSRNLLEEAVRLRRQTLGTRSAEVAMSLNSLGTVFHELGEADSAEVLFREALAIQRAIPAISESDLGTTLQNLGLALQIKGEYAAAEELYRESLSYRTLDEEPDESIAIRLTNLGWCLKVQGKLEGADSAFAAALAIRRELYEAPHPSIAKSLHSHASLLIQKGDFDEAEKAAREALAMRQAVLDEDHPDLADDFLTLAGVLKNKGDDGEAEQMYHRALRILKNSFGEDHLSVARVTNDLGTLLDDRGDYAGAEPLFRRAVEIYRTRLGDEHPFVGIVTRNVAAVLHGQGEYDEAERLYEIALRILQSSWGDDHINTANVRSDLGRLTFDRGDYATAELHLRGSLATQEQILPEGHWRISFTKGLLGHTLARLHRYDEGEILLLESYEELVSSLGPHHRRARLMLTRVVDLYDMWGKETEFNRYRDLLAQVDNKLYD
jgi:eukaryotic-like serine/threonine-protein kinase